MDKRVLVPIADGTEEIEAVTIIDVLRRAGANVIVASVGELQIIASRGVKIVADKLISECIDEQFDLIALPGGIPGAENLRDSDELRQLLLMQNDSSNWLAAICAAPAVVLEYHGLLSNRLATCHPGFRDKLTNKEKIDQRVVIDGNCVTSQGPGTALEFALQLVAILYGEEKSREVAEPMILK